VPRPQKEASDVFFAATKLFQAKDPHLRRMVYLCIKVCVRRVCARVGQVFCDVAAAAAGPAHTCCGCGA
jgi:hypothetical protein